MNQISDIYPTAKHIGAGLDGFLLKHVLSKILLNDATAYFFAVTKISDGLQKLFLAKVISTCRTDRLISLFCNTTDPSGLLQCSRR